LTNNAFANVKSIFNSLSLIEP